MPIRQAVATAPGCSFNCWPLQGRGRDPAPFFHRHADDELVLLSAGSCRMTVGDRDLVAEAPLIAWIGCDLVHALQPLAGSVVWIVQIPPRTWDRLGGDLPEAGAVQRLRRRARRGLCWQGEAVAPLAGCGARVRAEAGPGRLAALLDLVARLHVLPARPLARAAVDGDGDPRLALLLRRLEEHLAQRITLDGAARWVGLGRSQLTRWLRRRVGCTLVQLVQRIRVERACRQLVQSGRSILDIQLGVGFANQAQFNRVFRRLTGATPTAWRLGAGAEGSRAG